MDATAKREEMDSLRAMTWALYRCCLKQVDWLSDDVAEVVRWMGARYLPKEGEAGEDMPASVIVVELGAGSGWGLLMQSGAGPEVRHGVEGCWSKMIRRERLGDLLATLENEDLVQLLAGDW